MAQLVNTTSASSALLLLAACWQPREATRLDKIVELHCASPSVLGHDKLIIDTENWRLLHYDIDTDRLKNLITTPGWMKGVEKTWIIDKREEVLTVTSREAFSEQYFESRVNKSIALMQFWSNMDQSRRPLTSNNFGNSTNSLRTGKKTMQSSEQR